MNKKETMEREREKLYQLIMECAPKETIQKQSEKLDKHIVNYYSMLKCEG